MGMGQFFPSGYGYGFVCPLCTLPTAIPRGEWVLRSLTTKASSLSCSKTAARTEPVNSRMEQGGAETNLSYQTDFQRTSHYHGLLYSRRSDETARLQEYMYRV
jgi:hypothetical protein